MDEIESNGTVRKDNTTQCQTPRATTNTVSATVPAGL